MIYSYLLGGIGNLCFIIAATYALALDNNDKVIYSKTLDSITHRKNEPLWFQTIFKDIKRDIPRGNRIYKQSGYNYRKIPYVPNMKVYGYFQSDKHFKHRKNDILRLFKGYKKQIRKQLDDRLPKTKVISLHIRRTDYLKLQHAHVVQDMSYYKNAVNKMKNKLGNDYKNYSYLIFSDDINWCKKQSFLNQLPNVSFVEKVVVEPREVFELYLMSMCEHNIIANSSYSWWGAYLNENPNKIVIAPKKWFNPRHHTSWNDVYCREWIVVD